MKLITTSILADGICGGRRLTTVLVDMPHIILPQLTRHRVFSLSVQSSRAIPNQKLAPSFIPKMRLKGQGMQPTDEALPGELATKMTDLWERAAHTAAYYADYLDRLGCAKELSNRLMEPFSFVKVLITATDWDNFFRLRIAKETQLEMREVAISIKAAMDESEPTPMMPGEWQRPFWDSSMESLPEEEQNLISAARCARLSFLNHDNTKPSPAKDLALALRLMKDCHWSPFEHVATPHPGPNRFANFTGWTSLRYFTELP